MPNTDQIYSRFIDWMRNAWCELPDADSLLPTIKARYTPDEAAFLTDFPYRGRNLAELAELKGVEEKTLEPRLDTLARKGLVFRWTRNGEVRYSLNDAFMTFLRSTFWPGRNDQVSRATAPHFNRYFREAFFDQYATAHAKGLRTLPIDKTIADPRHVLPYEDVVKVLDDLSYYSVSHCACRHRKRLDPAHEGCEHPIENCLHFDGLGRYTVECGLGREITRAETERILGEAADAGLVHGLSNWGKPDTICNCCECCCLWMEAYHDLGHHRSLDPSNYRVEVDPATCKACGLCTDRCPMKALELEESAEATNKKGMTTAPVLSECLGCGVCVHACPTDSLTLVRKEEIVDPPPDIWEYTRRFVADVEGGVRLLRK
jgi:formate hydrogenlyase subunit 6/NADH:ubiquinone oxidoreductase subunit I